MLGTMNFEKLSNEDFKWFQGWLLEASSIFMEDGRKFVAEKRLHPLLWKHKIPSFHELCAYLKRGMVLDLHADVLEAITGNDTWFFRDPAAFEQLRTTILTSLTLPRASSRHLRIWSAGCASGQEAYSLAIIFASIPALRGWNIEILGTDLSQRHIERAQKGIYTRDEVSRGLASTDLIEYFQQDGIHWVAKPSLRAKVDFKVQRLDEPWDQMERFDLILMRNVLFHFDRVGRREACLRVYEQLAPNGVLMLGSNENSEIKEGYKVLGEEKHRFYKKLKLEALATAA